MSLGAKGLIYKLFQTWGIPVYWDVTLRHWMSWERRLERMRYRHFLKVRWIKNLRLSMNPSYTLPLVFMWFLITLIPHIYLFIHDSLRSTFYYSLAASSKASSPHRRSSANSFNFHHLLVSFKSSNSCLRFLPRLPVTSIFPSISFLQ